MLKILSALSLAFALTFPAYADDGFFVDHQDPWLIAGSQDSVLGNPSCSATEFWDDGSQFSIVKDIETSELYVRIVNAAWNLNLVPGTYDGMLIVFKQPAQTINFNNNSFEVVDSKTILVRSLVDANFIPTLVGSTAVEFDIVAAKESAYAPLGSIGQAVQSMTNCLAIAAAKVSPNGVIPHPRENGAPGHHSPAVPV